MTERDWNPIRKGGVYCSPACGFMCTNAAHLRACEEARIMCEELGEGWEPVVWENCGWNYRAEKGRIAVHAGRQGSAISGDWKVVSYTCYIHTTPQTISSYNATPSAALDNALADCKAKFEKISAAYLEIMGNPK